MTSTCANCGHAGTGRFCSHCGTNLESAVACAECGNELPPGGRFCNQCGAPTAATQALLAQRSAGPAKSPLPWVVAGIGGVATVALLVVLLTRGGDEGAAAAAPAGPFAGGVGGPVGDPTQVDIASMTERERADRLYNRVMESVSAGDTTQARSFLPMALAAYQMVPESDADLRYHVGVLALLNGDPATARAQADTILAASPDHLFGLYNAAEAERSMGNETAARQFLQRFLDVYDEEIAKGLPEYGEHAPALEAMRQDASRAVDSL